MAGDMLYLMSLMNKYFDLSNSQVLFFHSQRSVMEFIFRESCPLFIIYYTYFRHV